MRSALQTEAMLWIPQARFIWGNGFFFYLNETEVFPSSP